MVFSANLFSSRKRGFFRRCRRYSTIPKYLERVDWLSFLTPFDPPVTQPGRFCKAARTLRRTGAWRSGGRTSCRREPARYWVREVGKSEHEAGLFLVPLENVDTVNQPVGGKLFSSAPSSRSSVGLFCGRRLAGHPRSVEFFPMPAVEHEPVVGKPELAGGPPARLGIPVQVPLAQVGGRVSSARQNLGKGDDGVLEGHVVAGRSVACG